MLTDRNEEEIREHGDDVRTTRKLTLLAAGSLLLSPVAAACDTGIPYSQWAATDGAAGRINLEDVQTAFRSTASATDFERLVNEIYEGDGIILIRARHEGEGLSLEGWEDINNSGAIEAGEDDLILSIVRPGELDQHQMRGYGANAYYHQPFGVGDSLFTYMLLGAVLTRDNRVYETTPTVHSNLSRHRANFRNSEAYRGQVSRNTDFFGRQSSFAESRYQQAGRNLSAARQRYMSSQKASGGFKQSAAGVRTAWGSSSRAAIMSRSSSGFTGGGGARVLGLVKMIG